MWGIRIALHSLSVKHQFKVGTQTAAFMILFLELTWRKRCAHSIEEVIYHNNVPWNSTCRLSPSSQRGHPFLVDNEKHRKIASVGPAGVRTHHFLHSSWPIRNQLVGGQISRGKAQHIMKQKKDEYSNIEVRLNLVGRYTTLDGSNKRWEAATSIHLTDRATPVFFFYSAWNNSSKTIRNLTYNRLNTCQVTLGVGYLQSFSNQGYYRKSIKAIQPG